MNQKGKQEIKSRLLLALIVLVTGGLCALSALGVGGGRVLGAANIRQGLDLKGGVSILYEADVENPSPEDMNAADSLLRKRLDNKNYTEAVTAQQGSRQIRVDIPGVDDAKRAVADIGRTAMLTFEDEDGNVILTGADVVQARRGYNTSQQGAGEIVVNLEFNSAGAAAFADATSRNIGRKIRIYLDNEMISDPTVEQAITQGYCYIRGNYTPESAEELATLIREGSLPFKLNVISEYNVGARLGADALRTSILAGVIGIALVLVFMLVFYRLSGLAANIALIAYTALVLLLLSGLRVTLTLPGIAGIILSVGMAVDANIVIFERIREEINSGRSLRASIQAGYKRAFPAILDSNVTTLIAAVVLFWLGTGPVKGFAQTLSIGIIVSMFSALVVTRQIMTMMVNAGINDAKLYVKQNAAAFKLKIVGMRKKAFIISGCILALGLAFMAFNAITGKGPFNLDVEFSGGSSFTVDIGGPYSNEDITNIVYEATGQNDPQVTRIINTNQVMIKIHTIDDAAQIALMDALCARYGITYDDIIYSSVSSTVSADMQRAAVIAVVIACACMLIYVSWRFKDIRMGGSAILALLHDSLCVIAVYAALRVPLNYSFIAVVLTILGYSINATIIIFDRIRENRVIMKRAPAEELADVSVSQTLRRSVYTSVTTVISIVCLYIIGVPSIKEFTLPLIFGLVFGVYSSVFLAGNFWYMLGRVKRKKA